MSEHFVSALLVSADLVEGVLVVAEAPSFCKVLPLVEVLPLFKVLLPLCKVLSFCLVFLVLLVLMSCSSGCALFSLVPVPCVLEDALPQGG